jgi:hypothetical protein
MPQDWGGVRSVSPRLIDIPLLKNLENLIPPFSSSSAKMTWNSTLFKQFNEKWSIKIVHIRKILEPKLLNFSWPKIIFIFFKQYTTFSSSSTEKSPWFSFDFFCFQQKLVFDDNTKAPCRPSPAAASATAASSSAASLLSESSSSNEEIVRAGMAASFAKKFSGSSSSVQAEEQNEDDDGGDVTVWKKWWDPLPYKLVKISRQEFLGEQHQECESCDDEGEEDEREEYEDEQW